MPCHVSMCEGAILSSAPRFLQLQYETFETALIRIHVRPQLALARHTAVRAEPGS